MGHLQPAFHATVHKHTELDPFFHNTPMHFSNVALINEGHHHEGVIESSLFSYCHHNK